MRSSAVVLNTNVFDALLRHRDRLAPTVLTPGAFWKCRQRSSDRREGI